MTYLAIDSAIGERQVLPVQRKSAVFMGHEWYSKMTCTRHAKVL